ncbi:MAG: winged helix-turn-helix transcriptional regulator [Lentisphaerae bacterium]|jgi:ATP-dependent DNA helicase RecG|nr:winged helix-turn-helix transcriptional regulator [Lentisphaerota bacterium]
MTNESQNIEFKGSWQDEHIKVVCGFANADGGRLYIGKDDRGKVVGVTNVGKLLEDLPNKLRDHLGLMPAINLHHEKNKPYLEIVVEPSTVPISFRGSYYWRSGSVRQELKGLALNDFLFRKMGKSWDGMINERATLDHIDAPTIETFMRDASKSGRLPDLSALSIAELLEKLNLLTSEGLTNAALVLFGKDPGKFYTNSFVKIGRFVQSAVDIRFQEVCEGNLFQILHGVMEQLERKFLIKPIRFEGLRRIEELEYPVSALREMILNALVHRNYLGTMTLLRVMDDSLSLWNAGVLPVELTIDKLYVSHGSYPRNPLIASACYKAGYIDSWGRGIEKIREACRTAGLPPPHFAEEQGGFMVELHKSYTKDPAENRLGNEVDNWLGNEIVSDGYFVSQQPPPDFGKISERIRIDCGSDAERAFEIIRQNPDYTAAQIAVRLGKTSRTIENYIAKLKKAGYIIRRGPKLGGHWEVKV